MGPGHRRRAPPPKHREPFHCGLCGTHAPLPLVVWACVPKCLEHQNNPVSSPQSGLTALLPLYIAIKRVGETVWDGSGRRCGVVWCGRQCGMGVEVWCGSGRRGVRRWGSGRRCGSERWCGSERRCGAKVRQASRSQPKPAEASQLFFLLEEGSHILWVGVRV